MVRQRAWRALAVAVLLLSMLATQPTPSLACSCGGGGGLNEVVFVGRVVAVFEGEWVRQRLRANRQRWWSTVAILTVESMQRGPKQPFFTVAGGYNADGGVYFERGAAYFINAERPRRGFGPLETTICDGSYQVTGTGESQATSTPNTPSPILSARPRRGYA
ncbi:MAG: hypothetical protein ACRDJC_20135 [Thermomicrobiales bacterium]